MNNNYLDWNGFDWSQFQTMSIYIAENIFPDCNFDEYLKQGHKQEGIDILSFNRKNGNILTIQCKREKKISSKNLETILEEFVKGGFSNKASHFILITTADMQNPKIQGEIYSCKEVFRKKYKIEFECWDNKFIETRLKDMWGLVAYYFGKQVATMFCYPQLRYPALDNLAPVLDYIPRKVAPFGKNDPSENIIRYLTKRNLFELKDIFIQNRLRTNRICIIADAYQGKSSYLKQAAYDLKESGLGIHPFFIEIKNYNVQPVESILDKLYGSWLNIPLKDVIVILDGLDEAPTDKFTEMVKYVHEFSQSYSPVSIVLSCRKLFYNHYDVGRWLQPFNIYELDSLNSELIDFYLTNKLKKQSNVFKDEVYKKGIWNMLYHPFYLVNLVEEYLKPPNKIPANKLKVLDGFIERSYNNSLSRQTKGSESVKQDSFLFKQTIERLAFALQLAGTNSFIDTEMQQLFKHDERLLLQHNSLLVITGNSWSFTNALFQEHLAAAFLVKMDYGQIVSFCTVGNSIKKIKTKWIQTISSIFSLLEYDNNIYQELLELIEQDNIELMFQTESSKHTNEFKLVILKKFIEKCVKLNIRPMLVYEETIGIFIEDSAICGDYLINCLSNSKISERVKVVCCRILRNTVLNESQQNRFLELVVSQVTEADDKNYAGHLVEILSAHKIGDKILIENLIAIAHLQEHHEFRDNIYELITSLSLVDDFYWYGIEGFPYLIRHNQHISHGGSERNLQEFLLSTESLQNLSILLTHKKVTWLNNHHFHGFDVKEFIQRLFEKLTVFFSRNPLIILPVASFIKNLGRNYLREDFKEVDIFLDKTQSHWLVVRLLIDDILVDNDWELGALITFNSYDYLLFEYDSGDYGLRQLRTCLGGLRHKHKNELADAFYQLCVDITGGLIDYNPDAVKYIDYQNAQEQKRKNDLKYIRSANSFKKGLINYFKAYGKNSIPGDDIYVDLEKKSIRQLADSHFIFEYLLRWVRSSETMIKLKDCLKEIGNKEFFEAFRAEEIADYPYLDEKAKKELLPILEKFYKTKILEANFKNCMWIEDERFIWLRKEHWLGEIFKKFQFDTPEDILMEMVWLDNGGTRGFETADLNKTTTISKLILEKLVPQGIVKFKERILSNINEGIKLESVLGTHISLCKELQITEAAEVILRCLQDLSKDRIDRTDAVTVYLELNGDKEKIVKLYESTIDYEDYFFYHLSTILYKTHPAVVGKTGLKAIQSIETPVEKKGKIAQLLAEIGVMEGFNYLVEYVRLHKKAPHHVQSGHPISKIDTHDALLELKDVIYLIVDYTVDISTSFHDSGRAIVLEWLYALAAKSEYDLLAVIDLLENSKKDLQPKYSEELLKDLNTYINRMLEEFRGSDKSNKSIFEIKKILDSLN